MLASRSGEEIARLRSLDRAVVAACRADAHEGAASALHDRLHVGEVEVDQTRRRDEVGDALDTREQDLVGRVEGVERRHVAVRHGEQAVVRDDDERVDLGAERVDAGLRLGRAAASLEGERACHDTDGQRAERAGDPGDDGCATGPGATTLARRHEHHVGAAQDVLDLFFVVFGSLLADLGVGSGAEPTGEPRGRRRA